MRLNIVIAISLSGLIYGWVDGRATSYVEFNTRTTKLDDSGSNFESTAAEFPIQQPAQNEKESELPKNIENGRTRITRASPTTFDSPMKIVTDDYEVQFKNVSSDNVLPSSLISKIVSILGRRTSQSGSATPTGTPSLSASNDANKQLFGGKLPPFIERIIQRIQNYFSVYNPPEYFDSNRPPATTLTDGQHSAITLICSNSSTGSVSCNEMGGSEEQEEDSEQGETLEVCDGAASSNSAEEENTIGIGSGGDEAASQQEEYNVVVTHTIVQDSSLNVYSPIPPPAPVPIAADATQMVSNVVVILEPAVGQYSPPPLDNPDKKKFYVYVNPTKNQAQKLKTATESGEETDKLENFQPYTNTTYTVIIRGDQLQEYNTNLQNASSASLDPEIAIYIRNSNSTKNKLKKCKLPSQPTEQGGADCEQNANASDQSLTSRSASTLGESMSNAEGDEDASSVRMAEVKSNENNSNKVPNINLMLVPPNDQQKSKNKSCANKNKMKNPQLQYYVLKPDNGNKIKTDEKEKPTYYLQKTNIDAGTLSQTYLPPYPSSSSSSSSSSVQQPQSADESSPSSADLFITSS
ncbi:uncharacterized protein LOC135842006 [Planococcus citri]|uniref:uncharacterized protein LOC135842006 n=1 Tax=Planococcus citri TaxID=170843 RepID=UPI0031F9252E